MIKNDSDVGQEETISLRVQHQHWTIDLYQLDGNKLCPIFL